jgi:hypothetical protein
LVAPDGRFLVITVPEQTESPSLTVLVNWHAGLKP